MAHQFESCGNCGAPVTRSADGKNVECRYCRSSDVAIMDPARLAASLQAAHASGAELLRHLAGVLTESFPEVTEVEWSGGFLGKKHPKGLAVGLDGAAYRLKLEGHALVAERDDVVRGIRLKTERLSADSWLEGLSVALAEMAEKSEGARRALRRLR